MAALKCKFSAILNHRDNPTAESGIMGSPSASDHSCNHNGSLKLMLGSLLANVFRRGQRYGMNTTGVGIDKSQNGLRFSGLIYMTVPSGLCDENNVITNAWWIGSLVGKIKTKRKQSDSKCFRSCGEHTLLHRQCRNYKND